VTIPVLQRSAISASKTRVNALLLRCAPETHSPKCCHAAAGAATRGASGRVAAVFGDIAAPGVDTEIIIRNYGIPDAHSRESIAAAVRLGVAVSERDIKGRTDFRRVPTVTIDGANGGSPVTLSGGGQNRLFLVGAGKALTLTAEGVAGRWASGVGSGSVALVLSWTAIRALTQYSRIEAVRRPAILLLSLMIAQLGIVFYLSARVEKLAASTAGLLFILYSALTGVTFQLDAASNLLDRDPQAVKVLLKELKTQTQASIADIRRLVYNLRPPSLDELGLVDAIRERAAHYAISREADLASGLHIEVEAPEQLPPLPAAVEVAAYRIVQEALTNVVRHAHAHSCSIHLVLDELLTVEICDNGVGIAADQHAGVGMQSMHERATELGGTCIVEPLGTGGTRVLARLPLMKE